MVENRVATFEPQKPMIVKIPGWKTIAVALALLGDFLVVLMAFVSTEVKPLVSYLCATLLFAMTLGFFFYFRYVVEVRPNSVMVNGWFGFGGFEVFALDQITATTERRDENGALKDFGFRCPNGRTVRLTPWHAHVELLISSISGGVRR
jgi:hypothetical protein